MLHFHGLTADSSKRFLDIASFENLPQFQLDKTGVNVAVDPDIKYNVGTGDMRRWEIEWGDTLIVSLGSILDVRLYELLCGESRMRHDEYWFLLVVSDNRHVSSQLIRKGSLGQQWPRGQWSNLERLNENRRKHLLPT